MYYVLFLYRKDTIKSNTQQIFSIKSYIKAYYLTFLNIKIKDYYYFAYYLWYYYYYILYVSYYITYLIIYKEQKQTGKEGQKRKRNRRERGTGQRMPPPSSPVPRLSSVPSAVLTVRTIASAQHLTQSGRAGTLPRLWVMLSPPSRHRSANSQQRGRPPARAGDPLPLILPTLSTLPGCLGILPTDPRQAGRREAFQGGGADPCDSKFSGQSQRTDCSKYQLFIFSSREKENTIMVL